MPRITNRSIRPIVVNKHAGVGKEGERYHAPVTIAAGETSPEIELHDPDNPIYKALEEGGDIAYDMSDDEQEKMREAARSPFTPNRPDHLLVGAREGRYQGSGTGPGAPEPQPSSLRTPAATVGPSSLSAAPKGQGGRPLPPKELAEPPQKPGVGLPLPPTMGSQAKAQDATAPKPNTPPQPAATMLSAQPQQPPVMHKP